MLRSEESGFPRELLCVRSARKLRKRMPQKTTDHSITEGWGSRKIQRRIFPGHFQKTAVIQTRCHSSWSPQAAERRTQSSRGEIEWDSFLTGASNTPATDGQVKLPTSLQLETETHNGRANVIQVMNGAPYKSVAVTYVRETCAEVLLVTGATTSFIRNELARILEDK